LTIIKQNSSILYQTLKIFIFIVILSLLGLLIYKAHKINHYAKAKQVVQYEVFAALSTKGKMENIGDSLLKWLAGRVLKDNNPSDVDRQKLDLIKKTQYKIKRLSIDFALVATMVLALSFWLRLKKDDLALSMLLISGVCLWVGLSIPILTIESSQVLPVLGKTIFQYESKGILGSIKKLFANDNYFLAYLLLAFSVLLPLAKTLSLLVISLLKKLKHKEKIGTWFSHMGKWSMTDVFVVAILVVFFASSNDSITKSELESGLYFFAFYVILSLVASVIISLNPPIQGKTKNKK